MHHIVGQVERVGLVPFVKTWQRKKNMSQKKGAKNEEHQVELRRGPWTLEEDSLLIHYIARHGEGRWNLLARCSGLKRTGKSCRLRWLNYLKPDVKRGNLSPEEQFLILDLHSRWGNRWSRIAQYLPGRTDNEIKNYWRTRVQKQARQLKIDAGSSAFRDAVRCHWMPRLLEKMASDANNEVNGLGNPNDVPSTQQLNPFPQSGFDQSSSGDYSAGFAGQSAPCTYDYSSSAGTGDGYVSAPFEYNGYDDLGAVDLASASASQNVGCPSPSDCDRDWMGGLWGMDGWWHGRRPQEWSGIML